MLTGAIFDAMKKPEVYYQGFRRVIIGVCIAAMAGISLIVAAQELKLF